MEEWIEEFLFRGRPPSGPASEMEPTFHVVIGQQMPNPFDPAAAPARRTVGPLTPEAAQAMGWPLSRLVDGINTDAMRLANERAATINTLTGQLQQAGAQIEEINAKAVADADKASSAIADLNAQLGAALEQIAAMTVKTATAKSAAADGEG